MAFAHKNKTLATLLACTGGAIGLHRFYLRGMQDISGWIHFSSLVMTAILMRIWPEQPWMLTASPLLVSFLAGFLEALILGLTPDDKWDKAYNANSGRHSQAGWPLAVLLVLVTGAGAVLLIAVIARTLDLLLTGGAYG